MKISVAIATLNDNAELFLTVKSCLENTAGEVEIQIVDDASSTPVVMVQPNVRVHRNKRRLGVGPSRHLAACLATGDILFIVDSHCRFTPGWDEEVRASMRSMPRSLVCGSMIGFDAKTPFEKGKPYYGGDFNFFGPDRQAAGKTQYFETVWRRVDPDPEPHEIPACLGACYGMSRETYLSFGGLQFLRHWGEDEAVLSLKFWLLAGGVVFNPKIKIGHKFRSGKERIPYQIDRSQVLYNKLFAIYTLLPEPQANIMAAKIPGNMLKTNAMKELVKNWGLIESERHLNNRLADGKLDERFASFLARFNLSFPTG